ncbi:Dual oxidase [Porphyridium purpureum]|uniref:Dual oxidase n=1 Tax=Porphyridium purpureum TaxID=35688 RepID=A0A5J4YSE5_PORPP|nr:Dual oxidase [Porphyridium purpureum]|eukprot:POR3169..scf236_6
MDAYFRVTLPRSAAGGVKDIDDEGVYRDEEFEEAQFLDHVEQGTLRAVLTQQRIKKRFSAGGVFVITLLLMVSMLGPMLLVHTSMSTSRKRMHSSHLTAKRLLATHNNSSHVMRNAMLARQGGGPETSNIEWTPWDGAYNNIAHPEYGVVDARITRPCLPRYSDGAYQLSNPDGPNPRTVSELVMGGDTGHGSLTNKTAFLVFFGQQVVEEILDGQAFQSAEPYVNIPVPACDPLYDPDCKGNLFIPLPRNRYDLSTGNAPGVPRAQLNEISAWIDGTLFYGPFKAWADTLRAHDESRPGRFACLVDEKSGAENCNLPALNTIGLPIVNPPPPTLRDVRSAERFFRLGNPRTNENPMLLSFAVLWFRYHNVVADRIHGQYPEYDDEEVFLLARQWLIAVYQKIVFYDWLPGFLGLNRDEFMEEYRYRGYRSVDPAITQEFQVAAMRFGHTLVTPGAYRRDLHSCTAGSFESLRTCNSYFRGEEVLLEDDGPTRMLLGLASQLAEREDSTITPDLRGFVFGVALDATRRDLMAINIQRAREHGVGTYNQVRECFGLPRVESFDDISSLTENELFNTCTDAQGNTGVNCMKLAIEGLKTAYDNDIEKCDLWPCGLLEVNVTGPGPLFRAILLDQFLRIRDGDRFWFENDKAEAPIKKIMTPAQIDEIWNTTIRDVMVEALELDDDVVLQENPFKYDSSVCEQPYQLSEFNLEDCSAPSTYNWYRGNVPRRAAPAMSSSRLGQEGCEPDSLRKILFGSEDGPEHDDRLTLASQDDQLSMEQRAAAAGCPVYKAKTKLARLLIMQQVMMERVKTGLVKLSPNAGSVQRYVNYLSTDECGFITNADSLAQLAWTIAGIVMWLILNMVLVYGIVHWIRHRKQLRTAGGLAFSKSTKHIPLDIETNVSARASLRVQAASAKSMSRGKPRPTTGYGCLIYHSFTENSSLNGVSVQLGEPDQAHLFLFGTDGIDRGSLEDGPPTSSFKTGKDVGMGARTKTERASCVPLEVREILSGDITMISPGNIEELRLFDNFIMIKCKIGSARLFEFESPGKARTVARELLSIKGLKAQEANMATLEELVEDCMSRAERLDEINWFFEKVKRDIRIKCEQDASYKRTRSVADAAKDIADNQSPDEILADNPDLVHDTVHKVADYNMSKLVWYTNEELKSDSILGAERYGEPNSMGSPREFAGAAAASPHRNKGKRSTPSSPRLTAGGFISRRAVANALSGGLSKKGGVTGTRSKSKWGRSQGQHGSESSQFWRNHSRPDYADEDDVVFTKHEVAAVLRIHPSSFVLSRMFYEGSHTFSTIITARQFRRAVENLVLAGESPGRFLAGLAIAPGGNDEIDKELLMDIVRDLQGSGLGAGGMSLDGDQTDVLAVPMSRVDEKIISKYMNETDSPTLPMERFDKMIEEMQEKKLKYRAVGWQMYFRQTRRRAQEDMARENMSNVSVKLYSWRDSFVDVCKDHRLDIFWGTAYVITVALIFLYTWWYYYSLREVYGLRGILTVGLCVTRSSASVDMFVYSITLLPMCRNLITFLRSTRLHQYVPFDRAYEFHVITALTGEFFTALHVVGHCVNFYNITTQRSGDLTGYFRAVNWNSDFVPSFAFWMYETITGMTGLLLTFVIITMMVFAVPQVRSASFQLFWVIHHVCFTLLYTMIVLHGSYVLVQRPIFHFFLLGPLIIFILDKLYTFARESEKLQIVDMKLLPKGVTAIYVRVSPSFSYTSGQWARLKLPALGTTEFHPMTISSAPHESYLSFHVAAVGPWTRAVRELATETQGKPLSQMPTIRIDGPYGEGHQNWMLYDTVLLVGGGIGCTPFVSVLKDILHQVRIKAFRTTKVVAVFICKNLQDLAWITNEVSQLENNAPAGYLELLFFQTGQKRSGKESSLDAQNLAFEQAFQRHVEFISQIMANRSSLARVKGFVLDGRPQFDELLRDIQADRKANDEILESGSGARQTSELEVGVFACGSASMTLDLKRACVRRNRETLREIADKELSAARAGKGSHSSAGEEVEMSMDSVGGTPKPTGLGGVSGNVDPKMSTKPNGMSPGPRGELTTSGRSNGLGASSKSAELAASGRSDGFGRAGAGARGPSDPAPEINPLGTDRVCTSTSGASMATSPTAGPAGKRRASQISLGRMSGIEGSRDVQGQTGATAEVSGSARQSSTRMMSKMASMDTQVFKDVAAKITSRKPKRVRGERPVFFAFYGQVFSSDSSFDFWSRWKKGWAERRAAKAAARAAALKTGVSRTSSTEDTELDLPEALREA